MSRQGIRHTVQTQRPWMTSLFLTQHKNFQRPPDPLKFPEIHYV
ncbi:hypothetical protein HanPSC8_Chr13g0577611 [Helianthus annuus]|nr:hypothetical protein HanPSC8_Chr13g0577611 [Helianthus annuus]